MSQRKSEEWLTKDGLLRLEAWARDGLTLEQIAHNCGCAVNTLKEWREKYPVIERALKKGREVVDIEVENALYKRAVGYHYDEVTVERKVDKETGESVMVETKRVTKEVPPEILAQIYWLKNRKPVQWRDKREEPKEEGAGDIKVAFVAQAEELGG